MQRFAYEGKRMERAVQDIARFYRRRCATEDTHERQALNYEMAERQRLVDMLDAYIAREVWRQGIPLQPE